MRGQQTPAGPAGEVVRSIRTTYDSNAQAAREEQVERNSESITINQYGEGRLVSQETTVPGSKMPLAKFWNYWTFDQAGKLTEYRRGLGDQLQNHTLNFQRDVQGRLTGFEYRQGPKDEPQTRTAVRYSDGGKTAEFSVHDSRTNEATRITTQTLDDRGRVARVEIREWEWKTKKLKPPLHVIFQYDAKDRLVEQNTEAHQFDPSGSEHELPPGKISIQYDDVQGTKTTEYSSPEGRIASTLTLDANGATLAFTVRSGPETVDARLDCSYDSHGNWTACKQIAKSAGVGIVTAAWRRTITYR